MSDEQNPFDQLGLDPRTDAKALTAPLRQRAERALPEERKRLQGLWRQLTLKESDRIRWALLAHPRQSHADEVESLRQKVPPFFSRYKLPELIVTAQDLLVLPQDAAHHQRLPEAPTHFLDEDDAQDKGLT